jgi:hypothetical protein
LAKPPPSSRFDLPSTEGVTLADLEPPSGPDDSGSSGGLSAFLSTTPRVVGTITALIGAISGLLIALNKVGILGGDGGATTHVTPTVPTSTSQDILLFGPDTRGGGRGEVRRESDGSLTIRAEEPGHGVRVLADQANPPSDVSLRVRVKWVRGEQDWSFALVCRFKDSKNFYLLGVIPLTRKYNIARYRDGHLTSLTGLQPSDAIRHDENNVTARCTDNQPTTLTLGVNGETVRRVDDPNGLEGGNVGLRVGSVTGVVTCRFSDLDLNYLE